VILPSLSTSVKQTLPIRSSRYHAQTTSADSQPQLDFTPVGPIEIKSPASPIASLVQLVTTTAQPGNASLTDEQVLSLP